MQILVVNSGSSSIKMSLFGPEKLVDAHVKGINGSNPELTIVSKGKIYSETFTAPLSVQEAMERVLKQLDINAIAAVGHRVVHGGPKYTASVVIDGQVFSDLQALSSLAPLHNPPALEGIDAALAIFGLHVPQIAVFDTAFHRNMPPHAHSYGIDPTFGIPRYGFHGIAHAYLWDAFSKISKAQRIVTIHLGNGCSMAAICGGRSLDTSMGFTPAEGLLMGTRAGDIDVGAVEYLCYRGGKDVAEILDLLNTQSGLLGVSGISSDMRELLAMESQHAGAHLAIDLFCYRILKYLGAYIAVLGGVDAILFSGGIGENAPVIRQRILQTFGWCGVGLDEDANKVAVGPKPGQVLHINSESSRVEVLVVGVDENSFIARETAKMLPNGDSKA